MEQFHVEIQTDAGDEGLRLVIEAEQRLASVLFSRETHTAQSKSAVGPLAEEGLRGQ